ncbi:cytochrome D1 domain-containing protein [Vogesella sp. GCM10023246]|uniref:Cytochrome D1 domain-containing protein n=1 Tax=Vogesella oryzagri TaxID=3160864 RepID=A0ABV1M8C7_9NEIS
MRTPLSVPLLLACSLLAATAQAAPSGTVFTANERGNSISQLDLATGSVATVAVDIAPHNVQVTPDGKRLLAVGMNPHAGHHGSGSTAGELLVFDLPLGARPTFRLPVAGHPGHVITDAGSNTAFVSDASNNAVQVYDLASRRHRASIRTGAYPHGLRLSPDGKSIYVANMQDNTVSVLDVAARREVARIAVGKAPVQVGFAPDGKQAYVSLSADNALGLIDTARRMLSGTVKVGRTPIQMMATPDGRQVFVANQGSRQQPDDRVTVVDPQAGSVIAEVSTGPGAHGVAISSDGQYVFVSNIESATVSVIDSAQHKVVASYPVGAGPNGISYRD